MKNKKKKWRGERRMTGKKILIVDDDKDLSLITADMLESYGYEVMSASDPDEAFILLEDTTVHLILLDINLPEMNGFEVCRELRCISKVPVIFASARTGEDDKIKGLDIGGDDYLEKPYSLKELLARINALMRRTYGGEEEEKTYHFGEVTIETGKRRVTRNGEEVRLALKEFDVLVYLCEHRGHAVSKETILRDVWGGFSETELATVAVHIRWLREKLEEDPAHPVFIKTVWGVGYLLESEEG